MNAEIIVIDILNDNRVSIDIDPLNLPVMPEFAPAFRVVNGRNGDLSNLIGNLDEINMDLDGVADYQAVWSSNLRPVRATCVHCGDIEDVNIMITDDDGMSCTVCAD